ncbi:MAG: hypothetical protein ACL7BU_08740 [Candidatus Phlomobacter fragariae]
MVFINGYDIWFANIFSIFFLYFTVIIHIVVLSLGGNFTKRLHDRVKSGGWLLLLLVVFVLFSIDVSLLTPFWQ